MRVMAMQGDTLDQLCWRHLRRTHGVVEATLAANPPLTTLGAVLPAGTWVDLVHPAQALTTTETIKLWD